MESVSQTLGAAGPCPEVAHAGRTWKVGWPTQRAKAALEELAAARAVAEVRALKGVLPPDAYAEAWKELMASVAAGDYRTWGAGWHRTCLAGLHGGTLFLLSLLREHHPDATEADARGLMAAEPEVVAAAVARVVPGFFDLLLDGLPLPPDRRDATMAAVRAAFTPAAPTPPPPPRTRPSKPSGSNPGATPRTNSPG